MNWMRRSLVTAWALVMLMWPAVAFAADGGSLSFADAIFTGAAARDGAGASVAVVGDVNGDGFDDLLIGAPLNDAAGDDAGAAYLVLGGPGLSGHSLDNAIAYTGEDEHSTAGGSVAGAGDVNGDGFADLLIGTVSPMGNAAENGAAYLVLGSADPIGGSLSSAIKYSGLGEYDGTGSSVAGVGDVNGDGYDDLLIGVPRDEAGGWGAGAAYLVLGGPNPASASLSEAIRFTGQFADLAGTSVAGAGDVNGDGFVDLLIGAPGNEDGGAGAGAVYLVLGSPNPGGGSLSGAIRLSGLPLDEAGRSVAGAGDVNGDGFDDLLIGAPLSGAGGQFSGAAYLVLGSETPASGSLADAIRFAGEAASNRAGTSVAGVGDVNGDGFADLLVGAPGRATTGSSAGAVYLVLGSAEPESSSLAEGNRYNGQYLDQGGWSVGGGGDINGDGLDDLLIGAPAHQFNDNREGRAYLVLGNASPGTLNPPTGDVKLLGEAAFGNLPTSVAGAGDVNGDGYADLLVASNRGNGIVYLLLGSANPATTTLADAIRYTGEPLSQAALSVAGVGDVNGDGFDDILIGNALMLVDGNYSGVAYLILGGAEPTGGSLRDAIRFTGQPEEDVGRSVAGAGDVNGDGYMDLLIGAPSNPRGTGPGGAYLVLGSPDLGGGVLRETGIWFAGEADDDRAGVSVAGAGDVNGDGFDDLIIGMNRNDGRGDDLGTGAAYLVLGSANPVGGTLAGAIRFSGEAEGDSAGSSVAGVGDINRDGFDDLLIGAYGNGAAGSAAGAAYLVLGSAQPRSASLGEAIRFTGEFPGDLAGRSVAGAGDFDGDGYPDLFIGAPYNDDGGDRAGAVYLVRGSAQLVSGSLSNAIKRLGEAVRDEAGSHVAGAGDINGDGAPDLVFGAPFHDEGGTDAGAVYLLLGTPRSPTSMTIQHIATHVARPHASMLLPLLVLLGFAILCSVLRRRSGAATGGTC